MLTRLLRSSSYKNRTNSTYVTRPPNLPSSDLRTETELKDEPLNRHNIVASLPLAVSSRRLLWTVVLGL